MAKAWQLNTPDIALVKIKPAHWEGINLSHSIIIEDIPREWNVPQTVIKDKISQLFDEKWLVGVWNNFIECFNDNINHE